MFPAPRLFLCLRERALALLLAAGLGGCATTAGLPATPRVVMADRSPAPEEVSARDAWRLAQSFVASRPQAEILVGSGGSMLPLYRDRTVLVVEAMPLSELCQGMTVVFIGDQGRPVAHTLIEKTPRGWIAMGMGNAEPDRTPVQFRNYIGTVIKAFAPQPERVALNLPGEGELMASVRSGR